MIFMVVIGGWNSDGKIMFAGGMLITDFALMNAMCGARATERSQMCCSFFVLVGILFRETFVMTP